MSETTTLTAPDGTFTAYVARPATKGPAPALVVVQEIFGVNADLRATCDWLATQGFLAVCPDLFWRLEPNVQLTDGSEAEWQKALALYRRFDVDKGVEDIKVTIAAARKLRGSSGKAGVMGFCLGGLLTFLTAARGDPDAAVEYYGGGTEKYVGEASALKTPLLMHLAEEDEFMSKDAQKAIIGTLKGNSKIEIHTYPGVHHAFARHNGKSYDAAATAAANARTIAFLHAQLG